MSLVNIDNVFKSYGDVAVLHGVSLSVERGEVIAIIGRSGSGKSTLLRCINGLETPNSGCIEVDGARVKSDVASLNALRLKVGMVFQQFNLFPHLSVLENVALALRIVKRMGADEVRQLALAALTQVGLAAKIDAFPSQLSGGQQQRVAIARALAMQPDALLCDEITSALDPELVSEVLNVVGELAAKGMTLLMVTHEMRFAERVCDRVVFMHQGRIHESGPPDAIFRAPRTDELKQFLSSI